jgi:uncharacterized protein (DUF2336 family)
MSDAPTADIRSGLDLSVFTNVIESGDAESRLKLAEELGRLVADPETPRAESEAVLPCLLKLACDPVRLVRRSLAEILLDAPVIDAELAFTIIADDDEDIALPFLAHSRALGDSELAVVLEVGDPLRQEAVAARAGLSARLVNEIVDRAEGSVCRVLLDNPDVRLEPAQMRRLYNRLDHEESVLERLLARDDLPLDIRILQAKRASSRLHQMLLDRQWLPPSEAQILIADASESAMLDILLDAGEAEFQTAIAFMMEKQILTPALILRAACLGEMSFVERALAHLAGIALPRARHMLYGGSSGVKSLAAKAGLPESCVGLLRAAVLVERELAEHGLIVDAEAFGRRLIEALMIEPELAAGPDRAKLLDYIARLAQERVRAIAKRLKFDIARAA